MCWWWSRWGHSLKSGQVAVGSLCVSVAFCLNDPGGIVAGTDP